MDYIQSLSESHIESLKLIHEVSSNEELFELLISETGENLNGGSGLFGMSAMNDINAMNRNPISSKIQTLANVSHRVQFETIEQNKFVFAPLAMASNNYSNLSIREKLQIRQFVHPLIARNISLYKNSIVENQSDFDLSVLRDLVDGSDIILHEKNPFKDPHVGISIS